LETSSARVAALAGMKAKYTLQVASVREQAAAARIVKKLQQAGFSAYQSAGPPGSGGWYRVRVGAYETRKAAEAALRKFKDSRYKPIIIQR
jgi:cell division septation protein DedD